MTTLHDLFDQQGQSPWLDNLRRDWLEDGTLAGLVDQGIRGVTSNPTIFAKAIEGQDTYDEQFGTLIKTNSVEDAYWDLVVDDIHGALAILRPVYDASGGGDGFVSRRGGPGPGPRHRGHHRGGPRPPHPHRPAQRAGQDPGHPRGRPGHPPDDQRGPEHQRDPHLLHRPATTRSSRPTCPASRRWSPPASTTCPRWPAWPRSSSAGWTPRSTAASRRPPRRGTPATPCSSCGAEAAVAQARLAYAAVPRALRRPPLGGPGGQGRPGAAAAVGLDLHQEPGLPRPGLRGHPHRPAHRQHHARRHGGRLPRPRHGGPHRRQPTSTGPTSLIDRAGRRRHRHGGCGRSPRVRRAWRPSPSRSTSSCSPCRDKANALAGDVS